MARTETQDSANFVREPEIALCLEWLSKWTTPRKTINGARSSYGLKHLVEAWLKREGRPAYVSNDSFKEACRRRGITSKSCGWDSPNEWYALGYTPWDRDERRRQRPLRARWRGRCA